MERYLLPKLSVLLLIKLFRIYKNIFLNFVVTCLLDCSFSLKLTCSFFFVLNCTWCELTSSYCYWRWDVPTSVLQSDVCLSFYVDVETELCFKDLFCGICNVQLIDLLNFVTDISLKNQLRFYKCKDLNFFILIVACRLFGLLTF